MEQFIRECFQYLLDKYGLPSMKLIINDVRCSQIRYYGRTNKYSMTLATWMFSYEETAVVTLVHEIAHVRQHVVTCEFGHDKNFRKLEIEMLADFGLKPVGYKRAYYHELQTINGKYSWRR